MSEEKIVVYQTFSDPINANIVKGLLDSHGIQCFLSDENIVTLNAFYSQAVGGVKLNVFEKDVQRINSILLSDVLETETIVDDNTAKGFICPHCHSTNVAYGGSVKQKFSLWNMLFVFFSLYPLVMRKAYHCFDCDHEFKKA
ncbi:MAG TPA: DUF2007 domain-containing protein [Prolixibacteraceae bacterium]|nr:DUF2007 domain-containing protein [Prolixibacteraceae bacterium]